MYPNLYYAFKDLFNVELPGLRFVNSFGFFVALAFLAAAFALTVELKRKERAGLMQAQEIKIMVGKPASLGELLLNFLLGFLFGYKIIGLFLTRSEVADPQDYLFSSQGNWTVGIILGVLFAGIKWREKNRQKLTSPEERIIRIWPHDRVGDLVIYAALFGFLGAKLFHNFENWEDFQRNPIEALLSFSGLTFYGGLICAALAIWFYARKHQISFRHLCDAIAPALILAYAVGRIGCQVAGDGDWGVMNTAYVSSADAKVVQADSSQVNAVLRQNAGFYTRQFRTDDLSQVPGKHVEAPSWLPTWMVAYNYPHNVINEGAKIPGCKGPFCSQLPIPAFPTPFYETVLGLIIFFILWGLRLKLRVPGTLFAVYLVLNGLERFLIEQIRVNNKYDFGSFKPTQAELIAVSLVIAGAALYLYFTKKASPIKRAR